MSILSIFETVRHFYFNYHYPESSSTWIYSAFMRRLQFGIREMICFLIVGFLSYGTQLSNQLSLEYLVPVISILCLQQTFGSTLSCCYQVTLIITPLSIFLFLTQKLGLGYHDYLATELLLLFTSFCIAYGCNQVQTRKISLLYNVLYFCSNFSQMNIPSTFAFELLGVYIFGMAMALLVSILIFPLFATFDIENRFHYSLSNFQQMYVLIIQAFLCRNKMAAHILLVKVKMIEDMIQKALIPIQTRRDEANYEPVRYLQRIFNRKQRHIIDLTLEGKNCFFQTFFIEKHFHFILEQDNFLTSLMTHICSLELMVKYCSFNDYHHDFTHELESTLLNVSSCQSIVISSLISSSTVTREDFCQQIINLEESFKSLRSAYIAARLHRVKHALEFATTIQSEDHLSHAFFLFQLDAIIELLKAVQSTNDNQKKIPEQHDNIKISLKDRLKSSWPRLLSSLKSMIIVGVGSIFVLVPGLAAAFENGQWILVTLCVTQGDTVGGAFTTMKMRLVGTLLSAIWAYVTYLLVHDHIYGTLGMLAPWILVFGYLKLLPTWNYTATVAALTPVVINLCRLPYGDALPAGNFALLRIEESFVGISIAAVLTLIIFPIFAIDLLKDNIQNTLTVCRQCISSMHSIYDKLFHHNHSRQSLIRLELEEQAIESFIITHQNRFYRLINFQRTLVEHASLEPTLLSVNKNFSIKRYNTLVQQQINTFQMLYNIDATLMKINEYSENIEHFQLNVGDGNFLPNLHKELSELSKQLTDCFHLWTSFFTLTQTRFHQLFRQCIYSCTKLNDNDLEKHEQSLIDLYQTVHRLKVEHQQGLNRLLEHYLHRLTQGETYSTFVPYANNNEADSIFIACYAMYYSTTQLVQTALTLGETIHTILELETTRLYKPF